MAMLPFCGYHMGDYFKHWIETGKRSGNFPKIFSINWFRVDEKGKFIWPGFGENMRVLEWIVNRCDGRVGAEKTPIGYIPEAKDLNTQGLEMDPARLESILDVDKELWIEEINGAEAYFKMFGDRFPKELTQELNALKKRLD